jgi:hypothetical protein
MKSLGERRKDFHHVETFGHSFTCVRNCVKPHWDTNRVSPCNYAIKPYNERGVVGPLSLWNCVIKLCTEGDIYFIQSSFSTTGRCTSLYRAVVSASRFVLQHKWVGRSANHQYISVLARISMHDWTVGDKKRCTFRLLEGFFAVSYQSFTSWKPGRWNSPLRLT